MFNNYRLENDILYLYVDDRYEIGNLFNSDKNSSIVGKIKKYIKDHNINFNGYKVILLLSGLMLGTVYLNDLERVNSYDVYKNNKYVYNLSLDSIPEISVEEKIEEILEEAVNKTKTNEVKTSNNDNKTINSSKHNLILEDNNINIKNDNNNLSTGKTVSLARKSGEIINLDLEEYLIGVVAAEMPASFEMEALKAQAVAARTYTLKLLNTSEVLKGDVTTQAYKGNDELRSYWSHNFNKYYDKVKKAVDDTSGLCVKYNGELIDAVYHSTSNGYTEDSVNVWGNSIPYLKTVTSPWDTSVASFLKEEIIGFDKISEALQANIDSSSKIEIISKDESGRISKIRFNDKIFTGIEVRKLLGLRSTDFDFSITDKGIIFTTRGYGHGVGMSQYGANEMAKSGYDFYQILNHYYTNVSVVKI